jgi:hypothetical protein
MNLPTLSGHGQRLLTADQFHRLATVPAEAEWFANLDNPRKGVCSPSCRRLQSKRCLFVRFIHPDDISRLKFAALSIACLRHGNRCRLGSVKSDRIGQQYAVCRQLGFIAPTPQHVGVASRSYPCAFVLHPHSLRTGTQYNAFWTPTLRQRFNINAR